MGRIKTSAVKNYAKDMIVDHGDKFSGEFEHNKKALNELKPMKSKKMRNVIAGYISSQMQRIKKSGI